ncbi:MAG: hypothetical protein RLZZ174_1972 [Pseudomonadota bacterium]|jgi:Fis family transcriptional regulator|nr:Fis family transcriptional regulator [Pseudomonadales bacterium]MBL6808563.1 Fis family transcriptional regulator [Pseudomonadales bacterium]MDA0954783.1 Fis family transcriptional regulator [Pseudomonadota bacterium]
MSDAPRIPLRARVEEALEAYFEDLDGEVPVDLFALVMGEVEGPLLAQVMRYVHGNQSRAAALLGLSRGTLRTKLKAHGLL